MVKRDKTANFYRHFNSTDIDVVADNYFSDKKNDLFENIIKIIAIIVLAYSICRGLWLLCYEIAGYIQGKRQCWYKSIVYIEKCKGGKTKGAYVIENKFFEGEIISDYRRNKINYKVETFAVLLYFGHHKKMILLQE